MADTVVPYGALFDLYLELKRGIVKVNELRYNGLVVKNFIIKIKVDDKADNTYWEHRKYGYYIIVDDGQFPSEIIELPEDSVITVKAGITINTTGVEFKDYVLQDEEIY